MAAFWAEMPYQTYRLYGTEARTFLQGQVTQDVRQITENHCHYAAYCNHKGRMFANLLLFSNGDDLLLRLHNSVADSVIKRLSLFILRSDVRIEPTNYRSIGLSPKAAQMLTEQLSLPLPSVFQASQVDNSVLCALPNNYFEAQCMPNSSMYPIIESMNNNTDAIATKHLVGGHFDIIADTNESLLPQQTPLETWGAISYTKGCYVGQEIIARNKYLGSVKKAVASFQSNEPLGLSVGDEIKLDDKAVGKIINCHEGQQAAYLGIMQISAIGKNCSVNQQALTFSPIPELLK